jgi:hypothetical protein
MQSCNATNETQRHIKCQRHEAVTSLFVCRRQVDRYHFFPASAASFRHAGHSLLEHGVDEDYHTGQLARVAQVLTQVRRPSPPPSTNQGSLGDGKSFSG